jgi:hypothetical protein
LEKVRPRSGEPLCGDERERPVSLYQRQACSKAFSCLVLMRTSAMNSGYAIRFAPTVPRGILRRESEARPMTTHALRTVTADRSAPMRSTVAGLPPAQRARRTNDPFAGIRTNTACGRRIADLVRAYLLALGNPTEIDRQAEVIAAAELQVLAEEARSLALKQVGHADLDQVIRLQGAADRAVRKLGLPDRKREPEGPTLSDILADRYGTEHNEDAPEGEAGIIENAGEETLTSEAPTCLRAATTGDLGEEEAAP